MQQSAAADRRGPVAAHWLVLSPTLVVGAAVWVALHVDEILSDPNAWTAIASSSLWYAWRAADRSDHFMTIALSALAVGVAVWLLVAASRQRRTGGSFGRAVVDAAKPFAWLWLIGLVFMARVVLSHLAGYDTPVVLGVRLIGLWKDLLALCYSVIPHTLMLAVGAWLAGAIVCAQRPVDDGAALRTQRSGVLGWSGTLWIAMGVYVVVFSALAILQWRALWVPHGDAAMYEEHLWNVLHGKGFMSQLDGGRSFLGEHIQVIHLLLIPVYVLYPHLPTLNVCQSVALASAALPIVWLARDRLKDPKAAALLGLAYLMYPPMQLLNLELTGKTFRPITFCVPLLAWAFYALAKNRYKTTLLLLALAVLCKEELASVAA